MLLNSSVFLDKAKEFPSSTVFHDKDEIFVCLKGEFHIDDKCMMCSFHDIPLIHDNTFLLILDDNIFINNLHSIESAIVSKPAQEYFGEPPSANKPDNLKGVQPYYLLIVHPLPRSQSLLPPPSPWF